MEKRMGTFVFHIALPCAWTLLTQTKDRLEIFAYHLPTSGNFCGNFERTDSIMLDNTKKK